MILILAAANNNSFRTIDNINDTHIPISVIRVDVVYRSTEYLVTDSVIIVAKIYKSLNLNNLCQN